MPSICVLRVPPNPRVGFENVARRQARMDYVLNVFAKPHPINNSPLFRRSQLAPLACIRRGKRQGAIAAPPIFSIPQSLFSKPRVGSGKQRGGRVATAKFQQLLNREQSSVLESVLDGTLESRNQMVRNKRYCQLIVAHVRSLGGLESYSNPAWVQSTELACTNTRQGEFARRLKKRATNALTTRLSYILISILQSIPQQTLLVSTKMKTYLRELQKGPNHPLQLAKHHI